MPESRSIQRIEQTGGNLVEIVLPENLLLSWPGDLHLFYGAMIGENACALYEVMMAVGSKNREVSFEDLQMVSGMSSAVFASSRRKLEEFGLLSSFVDENGNLSLFELRAPKGRDAFFEDPLLPRLLFEQAGEEVYSCIQKLSTPIHSSKKRTNVTARFNTAQIEESWTQKQESAYEKASQSMPSAAVLTSPYESNGIAFDWQLFFEGMHNAFPARLRTRENLGELAYLAATYGVDEVTMRKVAIRHLRERKTWIDFEGIVQDLLKTTKISVRDADDYTVSPISFLEANQKGNGVVLPREKKVLVSLSEKQKLPNEVINTLIRYTLDHNDGAFIGAYVQTVGNNMARAQISTREQALEYLKNMQAGSKKSKSRAKSGRPKSYDTIPEGTNSAEDIAYMHELMKQVLGGDDDAAS